MSGLIIDKDKQAWNNDEDHFDGYSGDNCRQAFFLAHHQMLAYHHWLLFCPEEAALFCKFVVSKSVSLFLIMMKMFHQEFTQRWYAYQAKIKQAPGLPLTTGLNGFEVSYKLGREIATKMAVDGFVAPVLNPNAANVARVGGGEETVIEGD